MRLSRARARERARRGTRERRRGGAGWREKAERLRIRGAVRRAGRDGRVGERFGGERERGGRARRESETRERAKAREIGKRGHWWFVARSTYGNRYGPTTAVGMRSFFPFCVSLVYTWRTTLPPRSGGGGGGGGGEPLVGNPGRQPATGGGSSSI